MLIQEKTLQSNYQKLLKVAVVGGSNSVMRNGYVKTLQDGLAKYTDQNIDISHFALGGVTSLFGVIQNYRYKIAASHDVIFFEYCVNDRAALGHNKYTARMAGIALEGFIRQAKSMNPNCIIIILIFGTNRDSYYNNGCHISATYENVARRYRIPVINITEVLLEKKGINFIKSIYKPQDPSHYARPEGTKIVGEEIVGQIVKHNLFHLKTQSADKIYRMYAHNLEKLSFFSNFDLLKDSHTMEKSVFKNSLFEENIYTIKRDSQLSLRFRGRLLGIMLKSDWDDGLLKIKLGKQEIITSSFSIFVKQEGDSNINLLCLPFKKSMQCKEITNLTISVYQNNIDNYELDFCKDKPRVSPQNWKLNIIGIAYIGELHTL